MNGNAPAFPLHQALATGPGSWNRDDVILFTPATGSPLFRISASGGTATPVTSLDVKGGEATHSFPYFLPDGRHFLYLAKTSGGFPHGVYVGSLDSTERTRLFDTGSNAQYAQQTLFFMRGSTLMAQPFDTSRMVLGGEAVPLADGVDVKEGTTPLRTETCSVSEAGVLVYRAGESGSELVWRDRAGREIGRLGNRQKYLDVVLSPDAARASVTIMEPGTATRDVWIYNVARGLQSRFTFDPEDEWDARWSPDGQRVTFASRRNGHMDLYSKSASGLDNEEPLWADDLDKFPQSWSPDGRFLLYLTIGETTSQDLWVLPMTDRKPFPFRNSRFGEGTGQFSPDGHWIAYRSDETGRFEIYVAPFPGPGAKLQISTTGGNYPRWPKDGNEIFYVGPGNTLMAAEVSVKGGGVEVGTIKKLFQVRPVAPRYFYDVSPDGQRFLVNTADDESSSAQISLVVNWPALLKK